MTNPWTSESLDKIQQIDREYDTLESLRHKYTKDFEYYVRKIWYQQCGVTNEIILEELSEGFYTYGSASDREWQRIPLPPFDKLPMHIRLRLSPNISQGVLHRVDRRMAKLAKANYEVGLQVFVGREAVNGLLQEDVRNAACDAALTLRILIESTRMSKANREQAEAAVTTLARLALLSVDISEQVERFINSEDRKNDVMHWSKAREEAQ